MYNGKLRETRSGRGKLKECKGEKKKLVSEVDDKVCIYWETNGNREWEGKLKEYKGEKKKLVSEVDDKVCIMGN